MRVASRGALSDRLNLLPLKGRRGSEREERDGGESQDAPAHHAELALHLNRHFVSPKIATFELRPFSSEQCPQACTAQTADTRLTTIVLGLSCS